MKRLLLLLPLALLVVGCGSKGRVPAVLGITASNNTPAPGEQITLSVSVDQPEGFRTAAWSAEAGRFAGSQSTAVTTGTPSALWTAPEVSQDTPVTISVKVTNFRGNTDVAQFRVLVKPGGGTSERVQITGFTFVKGSPVITAGDEVQVTAKTGTVAPSEITWDVVPQVGSLAIRSGETATWISPSDLTQETRVQLRATAKDASGKGVTDYVEITVQPKAPAALKARIVTLSATKAIVAPGDQVEFNVTVADSTAVRDIRWNLPSNLGTLIVDRGSKAVWVAPTSVSADLPVEMAVTVYDVNGGQDTGSTRVVVRPSAQGGTGTNTLPKITGFSVNPSGVIQPNSAVNVTVSLSNTSLVSEVNWTVIAPPGAPPSVLSVGRGETAVWIAPAQVTEEQVYRLQATVTSPGVEGREQGFVDLVVRPTNP